MVELNQVIKYLKKNDRNLYNQFKDCIANPVVLVNRLVRHYQWIFEIRDLSSLDLQDRFNKNYLNLFLYAMESDNELANNFINYFAFSCRNCFDFNSRTWNIDLIFNTLIHQCSTNEFDLVAMYVLMASTFDRFIKFFYVFEPNDKLTLNADEVFELFLLIVNQTFYDDLKHEILIKRRNSFYHKQRDFEIRLPLKGDDLIKKQKVESLKLAKERSEQEFIKWDYSSQNSNNYDEIEQFNDKILDNNHYINQLYQQHLGSQQQIEKQQSIIDNLNNHSSENKIINEVDQPKVNNYPRFKPNPNIKIIKLRAFEL